MIAKFKRMLLSAVFIAIGATAFAQQQADVSGSVKDGNGDAVIGATVTEDGTKNATVTDFDGKFRLKTAQGAKLKISYIGYKTATVTAGPNVNVVLQEDNNVMEELVVTGYTTQRRADLTGSVPTTRTAPCLPLPTWLRARLHPTSTVKYGYRLTV